METIQNIKEKNTNNFYKVPGMAFDIIKLRTDLENILKKEILGWWNHKLWSYTNEPNPK